MALSDYIPICDSIVLLMAPLIEVVIHDIESDTILYIKGSLSRRKPGDQSLLHTDKMADVDKIIYPKINFDGRLVKSISVVLEAKWLLCINCDVSVFNQMKTLSHVFLKT